MTLQERLKKLEAIKDRTAEQEAELEKVRSEIAKLEEEKKAAEEEVRKLEEQNRVLQRDAEITAIATEYGAGAELTEKYRKDDTLSILDFTKAILAERSKTTPKVVTGGEPQNKEAMVAEMEKVIAARMGSTSEIEPTNKFAQASILDMSRALMGTSYEISPIETVERAMTTSDFPKLLLSSGNRVLTEAFDAQEPSYREWTQSGEFGDFRTSEEITISGGGTLDEVPEDGELPEIYISESGESTKPRSFGNKYVITRQALINDDLGAFGHMVETFGYRSANTANKYAYDMLRKKGKFSAYKMSDGKAIFHADHNNTIGAALDESTLEAGMTAMRKQVDAEGNKLNIVGAFLIVAPNVQFKAAQLLNSAASVADNKNSNVYNPHYKSLKLIVDAELADGEWYLTANRRTIKVSTLRGTGGRPQLKLNTSTLVRTTFEGVFDLAVGVSDFRGMVKGK